MHQVTLEEAATQLSTLIDEIRKGSEVVLTQNGQPVVKLVLVERPTGERKVGDLKGQIWIADDFDAPLPEFADYM